jgi:hypothetical protein
MTQLVGKLRMLSNRKATALVTAAAVASAVAVALAIAGCQPAKAFGSHSHTEHILNAPERAWW